MENNRSFENADPPVSRSARGETAGAEEQPEGTPEWMLHEETFKEEFIKDLGSFGEGQIVEGTIVGVAADVVFVDIGYKSEGEIALSEFVQKPSLGESIKVMIVRTETRDGKLILSKQRAEEVVEWDRLMSALRDGTSVDGKVVDQVKGGFTVDLKCVRAFLPLSQCMMRKTEDPKSVIGKVLSFKIEKIDGKSNVVLSQRRHVEELRERMLTDFFLARKEGDIVEGVVKNIVTYGAFVDLGGIDGLLHVNDIAWGRVQDPKKYLKTGDKLNLKVLTLDSQNKKVSLGLKQLTPDPWETFEQRYEKGMKCEGVVKKLTNFGAFIELEEGIEGLLHVSELSWTKRINLPKDVLKEGDRVEIMVLDFDMKKKNVSLGLKQVLPNPWDTIDQKYPIGLKASAKINTITKSGIFVELEEGIEGFLSSENVSWTKQGKNIGETYQKGDMIDVVVLSFDKEYRKIQVGMKQLSENPWATLKNLYPKGSTVTGKITSVTDFGVFVRVNEEIEGLIHVSHLSRERVENPSLLFKVGDEVTAVVLVIDLDRNKVTLSIKDYLNMQEKQDLKKYLEDDVTKTGSVQLGNLIDWTKIGK
jgi:small subunit ribosomal protein S1